MTSIIPDTASGLYDRDFALWCEAMAAHLKAGEWDKLDVENLVEEIEGLTRRDKRELASRLNVLLTHLLKRLYVKISENYRGWEMTIREQRSELELLLEQSPSLKSYFDQRFPASWRFALKSVSADYPNTDFPGEWQYSREIEDLLSRPFWLDAAAESNPGGDR